MNYRLVDAGKFARECGDPVLAEVVLTRSLAYAEQTFGPESPVSKHILVDLLMFYISQGDARNSLRLSGRL